MSDQTQPERESKNLVPFFPNYLLDEVIAWYVALAVLVVLASLLPRGLEEEANPLMTPAHIKPEWYFLFLYQSLKYLPRLVGVLIAPVGILLLLLVPFIDRSKRGNRTARLIRWGIGAVTLIIVLSMTYLGWQS